MEECPGCRKKIDKTLDWDNLGETFQCPNCGASLTVEYEEYYSEDDYGYYFYLTAN